MTLREHLEAIRDRHQTVINGIGVECGCREGCEGTFPCADNSDAVAALAAIKRLEDLAEAHLSGHGDPRDLAFVVLGEVAKLPDPERPAATPTTTEAADA